MSIFKKTVLATAAFVVIVFTLCAACACSPSNEEVIRETVTQEFDAYKNHDDSAISKIAQKAENEGMGQLGITGQDFAEAVIDGFDYSIDSIEVNDKKATVKLTVTSKSTSDFETKFDASVNAFVEDPSTEYMPIDEKNAQIGEIAMQTFKDTEIVNEEVTLEFELQESTWVSTNATEALGQLDSLVFAR